MRALCKEVLGEGIGQKRAALVGRHLYFLFFHNICPARCGKAAALEGVRIAAVLPVFEAGAPVCG